MINKVNFYGNPKDIVKDQVGKVMPAWKAFQSKPNPKNRFDKNKPYLVVCGDAGGAYPCLAVIDLDFITKKKLTDEIKKVKEAQVNGKTRRNKYEFLHTEIKRKIMKGTEFPNRKDILFSFMAEFGLPQDTFIVKTPSGGFHLYYHINDDGKKIKSTSFQRFYENVSIDIRCVDGIVYGVGTEFADSPKPYTVFNSKESDIVYTEGWRVAWATGLLNWAVCGVNVGDFISGSVDIHMPKKPKSEFIVWREAMFLLKKLGYNQDGVCKVFQLQGDNLKPDIAKGQIDSWWDKEDNDPKRIRAVELNPGEQPPKPKEEKGTDKWYQKLMDWWVVTYGNTIRYVIEKGMYIRYNGHGLYEEFIDPAVEGIITNWLIDNKVNVSSSKLDLTKRLLKNNLYIMQSDIDPFPYIHNIKNGYLNIDTLELTPHNSNYVSMNQLDVTYNATQNPTPYIDRVRKAYPIEFKRFERFIQSVLHKDSRHELMCFMYGPTSSGKSTVVQLVKNMFGSAVSNVAIEDLGDKHHLAPLVGKMININAEMNISYLNPKTMGRLKHISGGDGDINVNPKFIRPFDYDFTPFFFINACNQLPILAPTEAQAWYRRVWLVHFNKIQPRDTSMKEGIMNELDDWYSYLVQTEYEPLIPEGLSEEQFDDMIESNKEIWTYSAYPVIRICEACFERTDNSDDQLVVADVVSWISMKLSEDGYAVKERSKLTNEINSSLAEMRIYPIRRERQRYFTNVKIIDERLKEIAFTQTKEKKKASYDHIETFRKDDEQTRLK